MSEPLYLPGGCGGENLSGGDWAKGTPRNLLTVAVASGRLVVVPIMIPAHIVAVAGREEEHGAASLWETRKVETTPIMASRNIMASILTLCDPRVWEKYLVTLSECRSAQSQYLKSFISKHSSRLLRKTLLGGLNAVMEIQSRVAFDIDHANVRSRALIRSL